MLIPCFVLNLSCLCSKRFHQGPANLYRPSAFATDMCCDWNSFSFAETLRWAFPAFPENPEKSKIKTFGKKIDWFRTLRGNKHVVKQCVHHVLHHLMWWEVAKQIFGGITNFIYLGGWPNLLSASNLQAGCHISGCTTIIHQDDFP